MKDRFRFFKGFVFLILFLPILVMGECSLDDNFGKGIDISHNNGSELNYEKIVKKYNFVFIKATEGYPDYYDTESFNTDYNKKPFIDTQFKSNIEKICSSAKKFQKMILIAPYHFISPHSNKTPDVAKQEARHFIDFISFLYNENYEYCKVIEPFIDVEPKEDNEIYYD